MFVPWPHLLKAWYKLLKKRLAKCCAGRCPGHVWAKFLHSQHQKLLVKGGYPYTPRNINIMEPKTMELDGVQMILQSSFSKIEGDF